MYFHFCLHSHVYIPGKTLGSALQVLSLCFLPPVICDTPPVSVTGAGRAEGVSDKQRHLEIKTCQERSSYGCPS